MNVLSKGLSECRCSLGDLLYRQIVCSNHNLYQLDKIFRGLADPVRLEKNIVDSWIGGYTSVQRKPNREDLLMVWLPRAIANNVIAYLEIPTIFLVGVMEN